MSTLSGPEQRFIHYLVDEYGIGAVLRTLTEYLDPTGEQDVRLKALEKSLVDNARRIGDVRVVDDPPKKHRRRITLLMVAKVHTMRQRNVPWQEIADKLDRSVPGLMHAYKKR